MHRLNEKNNKFLKNKSRQIFILKIKASIKNNKVFPFPQVKLGSYSSSYAQ